MKCSIGFFVLFVACGASIAFAAPAVRPAPPPATQPASQPARFTIATYNINYGNPNLQAVGEAIRQARADVIFLQETTPAAESYLRRNFAAMYPVMRFQRVDWAGGFGFLSKIRLDKLEYLPPKHGLFGYYLAETQLGGRKVQLANVHLQPMIPPRELTMLSLLRAFMAGEAVRQMEMAHLFPRLSKQMPVLVAGDFNSTADLGTLGYLKGRQFVDSFASATPDTNGHVTWHWMRNGVEWKYRIDHIYHSPHVQTRASRIIKTTGSDHYLLVSTLTWASPPAVTTQPAATTQPAVAGTPPAAAGEQ